jgi:hypothetical protein
VKLPPRRIADAHGEVRVAHQVGGLHILQINRVEGAQHLQRRRAVNVSTLALDLLVRAPQPEVETIARAADRGTERAIGA